MVQEVLARRRADHLGETNAVEPEVDVLPFGARLAKFGPCRKHHVIGQLAISAECHRGNWVTGG